MLCRDMKKFSKTCFGAADSGAWRSLCHANVCTPHSETVVSYRTPRGTETGWATV